MIEVFTHAAGEKDGELEHATGENMMGKFMHAAGKTETGNSAVKLKLRTYLAVNKHVQR